MIKFESDHISGNISASGIYVWIVIESDDNVGILYKIIDNKLYEHLYIKKDINFPIIYSGYTTPDFKYLCLIDSNISQLRIRIFDSKSLSIVSTLYIHIHIQPKFVNIPKFSINNKHIFITYDNVSKIFDIISGDQLLEITDTISSIKFFVIDDYIYLIISSPGILKLFKYINHYKFIHELQISGICNNIDIYYNNQNIELLLAISNHTQTEFSSDNGNIVSLHIINDTLIIIKTIYSYFEIFNILWNQFKHNFIYCQKFNNYLILNYPNHFCLPLHLSTCDLHLCSTCQYLLILGSSPGSSKLFLIKI